MLRANIPKSIIDSVQSVDWQRCLLDYKEAKQQGKEKQFSRTRLADAVLRIAAHKSVSMRDISAMFGEGKEWATKLMRIHRLVPELRKYVDSGEKKRLTDDDIITLITAPAHDQVRRAHNLLEHRMCAVYGELE